MSNTSVTVKRHDTAPDFEIQVEVEDLDTGVVTPVDLSTATEVKVIGRLDGDYTDGPPLFSIVVTPPYSGQGRVPLELQAAHTATLGTILGEVQVTDATGEVRTYPGDGYFTVEVVRDLG